MQPVTRKKHRQFRHPRLLLALALIALAGAVWGGWALLHRGETPVVPENPITHGEIALHDPEDVRSVTVTNRQGERWTMLQEGNACTLADDPTFVLSPRITERLLEAAAAVTYQDILAEEEADWLPHADELGLNPAWQVEITYADGQALTLSIGDSNTYEEPFTYLTVAGDPRLYAMDTTSAEDLCLNRELLHQVEQPVLHKARMDEITFLDEQGETRAHWALQADITAGDALDHWLLTAPVRYQADGEAMDALKSNLANLRLGAYIGEATAENLAKYGLEQPRFTLILHQAAGDINGTDEDGQVIPVPYAESTLTFATGDARSEVADYVRCGDSIYLTSHYSLQALREMNPLDTLTRYTVPVPLGNLAALTLQEGDSVTRWEILREEDEEPALTRNGEPAPWASFEAAYQALMLVTVSGTLPDGWAPEETPHTVYTFESVTGEAQTVALTPFDALHDAVVLNGEAVFYLIRDGMRWGENPENR